MVCNVATLEYRVEIPVRNAAYISDSSSTTSHGIASHCIAMHRMKGWERRGGEGKNSRGMEAREVGEGWGEIVPIASQN